METLEKDLTVLEALRIFYADITHREDNVLRL